MPIGLRQKYHDKGHQNPVLLAQWRKVGSLIEITQKIPPPMVPVDMLGQYMSIKVLNEMMHVGDCIACKYLASSWFTHWLLKFPINCPKVRRANSMNIIQSQRRMGMTTSYHPKTSRVMPIVMHWQQAVCFVKPLAGDTATWFVQLI